MSASEPDLRRLLDTERSRLLPETSGEVSTATPSLAAGPSDRFALAVAGGDGSTYATDDADVTFTIQSVVKPFVYALALVDDAEEVHERIGVEPTGEPFDAVVLEASTGRPANPMVNAGALLASSLVGGGDAAERVERIRALLSSAAGRELVVDEQAAAHEIEHGDRNRALGYLMRAAGTLECSVEDALSVHAHACAVSVTAADLAAMAATLATWGRQPDTGERVLPPAVVTDVLSVMATCGMYDGVGRWVHQVGLPAKSGVSGGLLAVAPGRLGLGLYSPPLDPQGNSVRGVAACETLSKELGLHRFAPPR